MSKKVTDIVSYIGIIGWIIAYLAGDRAEAKFHLNQSLVLNLATLINSYVLSGFLMFIPIVGPIVSWVISIVLLVFWVMGLVYACKDQEKKIPLIGEIVILK